MNELIREQFEEAQKVLNAFIADNKNIETVHSAAKLIASSIEQGNKVISCGNGGSHCDAMHFAEELSGRFREDRRALPAIAISDPSHISCVGNDYGFDHVFSRFIEGLGNEGDVLFCLSTSGNSKNILEAIKAAKARKMKIVALTGKDGGAIGGNVDVEIRVPHFGYADRIQEIHIKVIHSLILTIEKIVN